MIRILVPVLAVLALLGFFLTPSMPSTKLGPAMRVTVASGMGEAVGSGIHIGNGYILTAEHVIEGEGIIAVYAIDRTQFIAERVALFAEEDLAVIRADIAEKIDAAPFDCAPIRIGEEMRFTGNPNRMHFLTFWGRAGSLPAKQDGWGSVFAVDGFAFSGMSGAGGLSEAGDIRSVFVGAYQVPTGFDDHAIPVSLGYAVPSSVICPLLARIGVLH